VCPGPLHLGRTPVAGRRNGRLRGPRGRLRENLDRRVLSRISGHRKRGRMFLKDEQSSAGLSQPMSWLGGGCVLLRNA
jgi:hypothetical protein